MNKQDWKRGKIKDICDKASSNIAQNKIVGMNGEYPVFGASGFVQNVDFYHRDKPYIGIVKDGSGVGRVNLYPAYSSLLGTLQYIIPKDGNEIGFVSYALQSLKLSDFASGSAIPHIYFRDYGECEIPVPPLPTQQRIVAELDCISGILEKKRQQLKELDNLAQAIFYDMFGDPVENDKGWEVKKLGEIGTVKIGPFGSLLHTSDYITGGTPLVNPIHMRNGHIEADNDFTISNEKAKELNSYLLKTNDFIFARRGDIGRCAVVCEKENGYLCGTGSLFVRFDGKMNVTFVLFCTKSESFVKDLVSKAKGSTMLNINCKIVENLQIPIPPLSLQQQFAKKIEAIERQKALINQSIKEVQTLFDCRMEEYFN